MVYFALAPGLLGPRITATPPKPRPSSGRLVARMRGGAAVPPFGAVTVTVSDSTSALPIAGAGTFTVPLPSLSAPTGADSTTAPTTMVPSAVATTRRSDRIRSRTARIVTLPVDTVNGARSPAPHRVRPAVPRRVSRGRGRGPEGRAQSPWSFGVITSTRRGSAAGTSRRRRRLGRRRRPFRLRDRGTSGLPASPFPTTPDRLHRSRRRSQASKIVTLPSIQPPWKLNV